MQHDARREYEAVHLADRAETIRREFVGPVTRAVDAERGAGSPRRHQPFFSDRIGGGTLMGPSGTTYIFGDWPALPSALGARPGAGVGPAVSSDMPHDDANLAARRARLMEGWTHPGFPWEIGTIADFIAAHMGVRVECRGCGRVSMLDLVALGEAKGRDTDLFRGVLDGLTCQNCGAKDPQKIVFSEG
jgi:hypothetical protein